MSIIASGTTTTTALVSTGNTDGTLQLQVNGTTPSVTLNSLGAVGVGSSPSYGTSGQVLTSTGSTSAPTWSTLTVSGSGGATASGNVTLTSASSGAQSITTTDYGQTVTLPDATTMTKAACVFNIKNNGGYPLRLVNASGGVVGFVVGNTSTTIGLADNSTAAGVWVASNVQPVAVTAQFFNATGKGSFILQAISVDSGRDFILCCALSGTAGLYGIVYNRSTNTWGSLTLIDSAYTAGGDIASCIKVATDSILVGYYATQTNGVVCSLSGTTITVNTKATATGTGMTSTWSAFVAVGSTYVAHSNANYSQAFTVSGTTVSIGTAVSFGNSPNDIVVGQKYLAVNSSSVYLVFSYQSSVSVIVCAASVSGTTITKGTNLTIASSAADQYQFGAIGSNFFCVYQNNGGTGVDVSIISVSGTTCTASTVTAFTPASRSGAIVAGNKLIVGGYYSSTTQLKFNIITNSSGTASAGTALTYLYSSNQSYAYPVGYSNWGGYVVFFGAADSQMQKFVIDYSGSSPTFVRIDKMPNYPSWGTGTTIGTYGNQSGYRTLLGAGRRGAFLIGKAAYNLETYCPGSGILALSDTQSYLFYPGDISYFNRSTAGANDNEGWCSNWVQQGNNGCIIFRVECATV